jgi:hypothetical protein
MTLNIHQSAADNFNQKASAVVGLVKELPPEPSRQSGFPSEQHVSASLTEKDIIGEIDVAMSDYRGKTVARFFHINKKRFGLNEENYKKVTEIAEAVQSLPKVRSKISCSFIEKALFTWIKNKFQDDQFSQSFIDHLDNEAKSKIKSVTSWIPIANLEVEIPFSISKSEIHPLSKGIIDKWETKITSLVGENKENASKLFEKIRKDYQGLAAVVTVIEAEPEHAFEYTMEEAQRITSVLGIFSGATLMPDIKCVSRIKGSENIAQATAFFEYDSDNFQMTSSIVDKPSAKSWRLSQRDIIEIRKTALDNISLLLAAESLKGFEKAVLNSVLLYSKSAFTADPVEKVVYMLSALESILLKNESEPIQQNLAERVAVFTAQELQKRKSIIKTIKSVYGVRSRYLHHGHTSSELELVSEFMMCVWVFFVQLIGNAERFSSKEIFIAAIDDHKLA